MSVYLPRQHCKRTIDACTTRRLTMSSMAQSAAISNLPLELVLRVIESLGPETAVALHPKDPTALTIKKCLYVSRAIYPTALRLLYTHCLYIDSSDRLCRLLVALNKRHPSVSDQDDDVNPERDSDGSTDPLTCLTTNTLRLPAVDIRPCLQNLYLSPFPATTIDDLPTAQWIFELFTMMRHTLRRLVSVIPLHTLPPWKDHLSVRLWLRKGFTELQSLEEFVCLCDELDLTVYEEVWSSEHRSEQPIWAAWTKLRRLSLRKFDMARPRFAYLKDLPALESFVMVVTLHPFSQQTWNVVFERFTRDRGGDVRLIWPAVARCEQFFKDSGGYAYHTTRIDWAQAWNDVGRGAGRIDFRAVAVDREYVPDDEEEERHLLHLQTWMTERALEGSLWDMERCKRFRRSELNPRLWIDSPCEKEDMVFRI